MKLFISEIKTGDEVTEFFLCTACSVKKTKRDKSYLVLTLADKTGELDSRVWDIPPEIGEKGIPENTFVKAHGNVEEYRDVPQFQVKKIRIATEGECDPADFFRCSENDVGEMWDSLWKLLTDHVREENPLAKLLALVLSENGAAFKKAPAAKSVHHCFLGGLLEHVLSLCRAAVPICEHYKLRKDLVLATCVLHDFGKLWELDCEAGISYSTEGSLLGHISIGMMKVSEYCARIPEFSQKLKVELLHMIASHHGLLQYSSPVVPMMREAMAMHMLDSLDAKMEICKEIVRKNDGGPVFAAYSKYIDTFLYKDLA